MDIGLIQTPEFEIDIQVKDGALVLDDGLETAVLISLLTDARARDEDVLPEELGSVFERRGWWGQSLLELESGFFGSRLWLNQRDKILIQTIENIQENALDSLRWLEEEGVASEIEVTVERAPRENPEDIGIAIRIQRPSGDEVNFRFSGLWDGTIN